jgi:hypothetical protein
MNLDLATDATVSASAELRAPLALDAHPHNVYVIECRDAEGALRWRETLHNLIPDAGANDLLTQYLKGVSYSPNWYMGLIDNAGFTGLSNADTPANHPGWVEAQYYSQATRPGLVLGAAAARAISNSASPAVFSINGTGNVNGAFVASSANKADASGVLYGEASFPIARSVLSGDTLNVSVTLTA